MAAASDVQDDDLKEDYTLLAVLGERPQVMTELIWSLAQDGEMPGRIIALTTARGERILRAILLGDSAYRRDFQNWNDRWTPFCNQVLGSDPLNVEVQVPYRDDGTKIEDIYAPQDGRLFENWCFDLVHSLTREIDGPPLYGCIAGGRKTMAQDVTTAFTLYARGGDRLFHVIVPEEVEDDETFFWPREDRPQHAKYADDVHRLDKFFPHLRARLEDGLLSEIGDDLDERSHYQDLLDALAGDRQALVKPRQVTLRIQRGASTKNSESALMVWDATGERVTKVRLKLKHLATLLFLWNWLWRPGERKLMPHTLLKSETADKKRKSIYEIFHDHTVSPLSDDFRPWYPKDKFYTEHGNNYNSAYSNSTSPLKTEVFEKEPVLRRYFLIESVTAARLPDELRDKQPVLAFPRPLPEDIKLHIEIAREEDGQLEQLATEEGWPFSNLPLPEVVDS